MKWSELQTKCKNRLGVFSSNAQSRRIRKNVPRLTPSQQSFADNHIGQEKGAVVPIFSTAEPLWSDVQISEAEIRSREIQSPLQRVDFWELQTESTISRQKRKSAQFECEEYDEDSKYQRAKSLKRCSAPVDRTRTNEMLGRRRTPRRGRSLEQLSWASRNRGAECFPPHTIPETNEMLEIDCDAYQFSPMSSVLNVNCSVVGWTPNNDIEIFDEPLLHNPAESTDALGNMITLKKSLDQLQDMPTSPEGLPSTWTFEDNNTQLSILSKLPEQDRKSTGNSSVSEALSSDQYTIHDGQECCLPNSHWDFLRIMYCPEHSCGPCSDDQHNLLDPQQAWHLDNLFDPFAGIKYPELKFPHHGSNLFYDLDPKSPEGLEWQLDDPIFAEILTGSSEDTTCLELRSKTPFEAWCFETPTLLHNQPLPLRNKKSISQEPLFPCTMCNKYSGKKAFKRKDHLDQHLRSFHNVENLIPIYCPHPSCNLSLLNYDGNKAFESSKDYHEHLRNIHEESMWNCPIVGCGRRGKKGYSGKANLVNHLREKHGLVWNEEKILESGKNFGTESIIDGNMI